MSAILSADDLNDFISPGLACIKPIENIAAQSGNSPTYLLENEVVLHDVDKPAFNTNKPAQISLTDCLACSGCVTSAEALLVSIQSHSEVLNVVDSSAPVQFSTSNGLESRPDVHVTGLDNPNAKVLVASVAPQVLASISAALCTTDRQVSPSGVFGMITRFLTEMLKKSSKNGAAFSYVVSTEQANELCLHLSALETLSSQIGRENKGSGTTPRANSLGTTHEGVHGAQKLPILASACPGWVCYAEKTHPYVLPHLSRVKSPQAITGILLKSILAYKFNISPEKIWHLAIMPCFDKKLEAAREELTSSSWWAGHQSQDHNCERGYRDVDCVITAKEIFLMADEREIDFCSLSHDLLPSQIMAKFPDSEFSSVLADHPNNHGSGHYSSCGFLDNFWRPHSKDAGTSGGMLYYILQRAAMQHPGSIIRKSQGSSPDVIEYSVVDESSGKSFFKAARYYGFRNIQNLVRKLKPPQLSRLPGAAVKVAARRPGGMKLDYSYVEVMACPGGCTNGGGQLKVDDQVVLDRHSQTYTAKPNVLQQKHWQEKVNTTYFSGNEGLSLTSRNNGEGSSDVAYGISASRCQAILDRWSEVVGVELEKLVYTSYKEVVSKVGTEGSNVEQVSQLAAKVGSGW